MINLLALMENTLSFYLENPHCDWLSAFFTVKAETQTEKETSMMAYIDQQEKVIEKANLIVASKISSLSVLTDETRRTYGGLFQQAYTDKSLSEREIKVIWLSLSEMKTPTTKTCAQAQFFENLNNQTHHHLRTRNYP